MKLQKCDNTLFLIEKKENNPKIMQIISHSGRLINNNG